MKLKARVPLFVIASLIRRAVAGTGSGAVKQGKSRSGYTRPTNAPASAGGDLMVELGRGWCGGWGW